MEPPIGSPQKDVQLFQEAPPESRAGQIEEVAWRWSWEADAPLAVTFKIGHALVWVSRVLAGLGHEGLVFYRLVATEYEPLCVILTFALT